MVVLDQHIKLESSLLKRIRDSIARLFKRKTLVTSTMIKNKIFVYQINKETRYQNLLDSIEVPFEGLAFENIDEITEFLEVYGDILLENNYCSFVFFMTELLGTKRFAVHSTSIVTRVFYLEDKRIINKRKRMLLIPKQANSKLLEVINRSHKASS
jgi:hypothetical protein